MDTVILMIKIAFYGALLTASLVFLFFALVNPLLAAPFVPSGMKQIRKMVQAADLKPEDIVYDLGSGDGRIVRLAAKKGVKHAEGYEINPLLNRYATFLSFVQGLKNTRFKTQSLWKADISKASKLFVYLLPKSMAKLEKWILEEMEPGSLVISNTFSFKNLEPEKVDGTVRVYRIPERKES